MHEGHPTRVRATRSSEMLRAAERPAMASSRRSQAPNNMVHHQHTRLYKAPQPTIRLPMASSPVTSSSTPVNVNNLGHVLMSNNSNDSKAGVARRRRQASSTKPPPPPPPIEAGNSGTGTGFRGLERQLSNGSMSDDDLLQTSVRSKNSSRAEDLFRSVPDGLTWKPAYAPSQPSTSNHTRIHTRRHTLLGDMSEVSVPPNQAPYNTNNNNSNDLFVSDREQQRQRTKHANNNSLVLRHLRSFFTPIHILQLFALLCLTAMMYDSHYKVKAHRSRLNQYDEERSHILEQMMWMDKAAKKVHAASAAARTTTLEDPLQPRDPMESASLETLKKDVKRLQQELEHIQVRIQLNARDKIHEKYANKPITVTLQLKLTSDPAIDERDEYPIVLELSDDTPHAVNVLLQQIDSKQWDAMVFETIKPGVVQVSSLTPTGTPLLEFVEDSRSCSTAGSVALHGAIVDQIIHVLYLRIYLQDNAVLPSTDVCIGRVLSGLEYLHHVPV